MSSTRTETKPHPPACDMHFLLFLAFFYAAWTLRVVLLMPIDAYIENEWIQQCWSQGLRLSLWIAPLLIYLKKVEHAIPIQFLKLDTFPRGKSLLQGAGIMAAFLLACVLNSIFLQGGSLSRLSEFTTSRWISLISSMSIISIVEEIVYRGFIFQKLRSAFSFHRTNLYTAFLFLLIHLPGWLYMQGPHWGMLTLAASIFVAGWIFGWVREVTASLWPPIIVHFLNNIAFSLFLS